MTNTEDVLPEGWRGAKLGDIADVRLGKMLSAKTREPGLNQLPYLRNENVRWGHVDVSDVKTMGFKDEELGRYSVAPGDLLVCEGGEPGRAAIYTGPPQQFMYQKALHRVRLQPDAASAKYVQYFFQHYATRLKTSQTTIAHFPLERMKELVIPLAPRDQQERIVAEIEKQSTRLDAGVEALRRLQAHLRRYRAAVLKAAVEGALAPQGAMAGDARSELAATLGRVPLSRVDAAPLPHKWHWASASDLFAFVTSGSRGWAKFYSDSGARFLRIGNMQRLSVSLDLSDVQHVSPPTGGEGTRTLVRPGDVLVSITADLGKIAVVTHSLGQAYVNQHLALARPVPGVEPAYLAWFLASPNGQQQLLALGRGATKVGLGLDDIRAAWIPLPPLEIQRVIVAEIESKLSVADAMQSMVQRELARATRLRAAVLRSAFEGRLAA